MRLMFPIQNRSYSIWLQRGINNRYFFQTSASIYVNFLEKEKKKRKRKKKLRKKEIGKEREKGGREGKKRGNREMCMCRYLRDLVVPKAYSGHIVPFLAPVAEL